MQLHCSLFSFFYHCDLNFAPLCSPTPRWSLLVLLESSQNTTCALNTCLFGSLDGSGQSLLPKRGCGFHIESDGALGGAAGEIFLHSTNVSLELCGFFNIKAFFSFMLKAGQWSHAAIISFQGSFPSDSTCAGVRSMERRVSACPHWCDVGDQGFSH